MRGNCRSLSFILSLLPRGIGLYTSFPCAKLHVPCLESQHLGVRELAHAFIAAARCRFPKVLVIGAGVNYLPTPPLRRGTPAGRGQNTQRFELSWRGMQSLLIVSAACAAVEARAAAIRIMATPHVIPRKILYTLTSFFRQAKSAVRRRCSMPIWSNITASLRRRQYTTPTPGNSSNLRTPLRRHPTVTTACVPHD